MKTVTFTYLRTFLNHETRRAARHILLLSRELFSEKNLGTLTQPIVSEVHEKVTGSTLFQRNQQGCIDGREHHR